MAELLETLRDALADRYAVERELGRGGMATVFLARDRKHRRPVAIKVLHPEIAAAIGPERFLREIEIAAQLQHPHILPLYDSGEAAGYLYYVMPFVEGESLRDRLGREKQLPQEDVVRIASEVASALGYAHGHGIVHRDVKPENILLSGGTAVVADFGIARAVSTADQRLTQTGTVIGTPYYMSPEQAAGGEIDGRSDQYSLACVVYEMLVGEPPFTGPNVQSIMARHSMAAVSPPSIVRASIPDGMERALLRALDKTPADRFPTVTAFAEALAVPARATPVPAPLAPTVPGQAPASPAARPPAPVWRRTLRWGAPVVALLAAAWLARAWWLGRGGGPASAAEGPDPRRIAVLYFSDRTRDQSLGYLADGLTEGLIHELSAVPALHVISRNGVAPYRHHPVSADSLRRALDVGTIVDGTLAPDGDYLRLDVSMTDAGSGEEVGSAVLRVSRGNPLALRDTLPGQVAFLLRRRLGEEIRRQEARAGTRNPRAWELLERAKELALNLDTVLPAGDTAGATRILARADTLLARAAAADPRWSAPVLERGWLAWQARQITAWDKGAADDWTRRGLGFADAALALEPDDPEALDLRGRMRYVRWLLNLDPAPLTADRLLAAAEADLRAGSAERNPNRADALSLLSHLLARKSETVEAKLTAMQAYEADPYLSDAERVLGQLSVISIDLEDLAEATKWCREGRRRFPNLPQFTECQILVQAIKGSRPEVPALWRLLDQTVALYPPAEREYRRRRTSLLVAMALANAGLQDSARAVAVRARAGPDVDPVRELVYLEMLLRSALGDRDEAIRLLKLYLATNPQDKATIAADSTWWWRKLRPDPEFRRLVGLK